MDNEEFLIHELAERAGVTVRTIRYYTIEGLLPQPVNRGKYAYYTMEHVHRLELIRRLKDAYLPLREIRQTLSSMSDGEVLARLHEHPPVGSEQPPSVPAPAQRAPKALDYIAQLMDRQSSLRSHGEKPKPKPVQIREQPSLYADAPEQVWRRIELAPGVELHIRQPAESFTPQSIQQILAGVRRQLQIKS
jgi:DNA-binding transcriptional MerR regulator